MPRVQNPSLGPGQAPLLVNTVTLTAAQIIAMSATPITVVPAPGAGEIIAVMGVAYAYHFGTRKFTLPAGDTDFVYQAYEPSGDSLQNGYTGLLTGAGSAFAFTGSFAGPVAILPGDDNSAVAVSATDPYNAGPIATATLGAGGLGYAANDTGTITTGSADATYKVLTVGAGGAVLTFQITGPGTAYVVGNGQATATGGAQPGVGVGLTINVTAVNAGDGTLKVTTYYQIIPVP